MIRRLILAAFALVLGVLPAAAATVAVTPETADAAFKAAQAGDTLVLTGGPFAHISMKARAFSPPLTVDASGAQLASVWLSWVSGIEWHGGAFQPNVWSGAFYATSCAGVHVSGIATTDSNRSTGVVLRGCSDVSLTDSRIAGATVGLTLIDDSQALVRGNEFIGVSADGAQLVSSDHVTFEWNTCAGGLNAAGHHPDCAQAWRAVNDPHPANNLIVRRNFAGRGTQGFTDFGGGPVGYDVVTVEYNYVMGDFPQGIGYTKATHLAARFNRAATVPGAKWQTKVAITAPGAVTCENTTEAYGRWPALSDGTCPAAAP